MQVGTTKDQGLYNKPSAAVHPGALATGTLPQYNTIIKQKIVLSLSLISYLRPVIFSTDKNRHCIT